MNRWVDGWMGRLWQDEWFGDCPNDFNMKER